MSAPRIYTSAEAQALLKFTLSGPWVVTHREDAEYGPCYLVHSDKFPVAFVLDEQGAEEENDAALLAAAPDLAHSVAHWERAASEANADATQALLDTEKARAEATELRAQLDELKRAVHVHLWQTETWGGAHATEAVLEQLVPRDYAPIADDATEAMLDAFAARHPEDVEKIRAVIRVANGGGSPAECREAAGLTVGQAAKVAGVPRERIEAIEQGAEATAEEFAKLTHAYDVPGWAR